MQLVRTLLIVETAERHVAAIEQTNLDRAAISIYLARVASITFFGEMEERIRTIVASRLGRGGDARLATFLAKTNEGVLKRMKRSDIADTVALFGDDCKEEFRSRLSEEDFTKYQNVIRDRHETAHGAGGDVTLSEVRDAVEIAERLLVALRECIA
jgi:hypothetical protein